MRQICASLSILLLLSACTRTQDNFKPTIVITEPKAGTLSATGKTTVRGYAIDNTGIARLVVNGKNLMAEGNLRGTEGRRILPFAFVTEPYDKTDTKADQQYSITATDMSGQTVTQVLPILVDNTAPKIEISDATYTAGSLRISGTVFDNTKVNSILMNGNAINIKSASKVPFYTETKGLTATITAIDSVGNQAEHKVDSEVRRVGNDTTTTPDESGASEPPEITITSKEARPSGGLRVEGYVTDDVEVSSVTAAGTNLGLRPAKRVVFYAETYRSSMQIQATDSDDNVVNQTITL